MKKVLFAAAVLFNSCSSREKYDVANYYNVKEKDQVLAIIVTYIFDAPPYTKMEDRFKPEHRRFYLSLTSKFSINKYFIADDGTHYFYVIRPAPKIGENRGVGGHFKMNDNFLLTEFREEFVTPILPEADIKGRCAFLFDEMVKGDLKKYLKMESFVQWPNEISYYDTLTYEWKMKP